MAVTKDDLAKFNQFAEGKLSNGGVDSMATLFRSWLDAINTADIDRAIREGLADIDAGRTRPHEEFMQEVHEKLGTHR